MHRLVVRRACRFSGMARVFWSGPLCLSHASSGPLFCLRKSKRARKQEREREREKAKASEREKEREADSDTVSCPDRVSKDATDKNLTSPTKFPTNKSSISAKNLNHRRIVPNPTNASTNKFSNRQKSSATNNKRFHTQLPTHASANKFSNQYKWLHLTKSPSTDELFQPLPLPKKRSDQQTFQRTESQTNKTNTTAAADKWSQNPQTLDPPNKLLCNSNAHCPTVSRKHMERVVRPVSFVWRCGCMQTCAHERMYART